MRAYVLAHARGAARTGGRARPNALGFSCGRGLRADRPAFNKLQRLSAATPHRAAESHATPAHISNAGNQHRLAWRLEFLSTKNAAFAWVSQAKGPAFGRRLIVVRVGGVHHDLALASNLS